MLIVARQAAPMLATATPGVQWAADPEGNPDFLGAVLLTGTRPAAEPYRIRITNDTQGRLALRGLVDRTGVTYNTPRSPRITITEAGGTGTVARHLTRHTVRRLLPDLTTAMVKASEARARREQQLAAVRRTVNRLSAAMPKAEISQVGRDNGGYWVSGTGRSSFIVHVNANGTHVNIGELSQLTPDQAAAVFRCLAEILN